MASQPVVGSSNSPHICVECGSNLWCNQRVIKSVMSLRCFVCKANKKLNKNSVWYEWKCDTFHMKSECPLGTECSKMHIYYSKMQARNCKVDNNCKPVLSPELPKKTSVSRVVFKKQDITTTTLNPYAVDSFSETPVSGAYLPPNIVISEMSEDISMFLLAVG